MPDTHGSLPPNKAVPVTVAIMRPNKVLIQLPLPDIRTTQRPTIIKPKYLITKLTTTPHKWERPLWHTIQHQQETWMLAEDLARGIPVLLSTDTAMNAAK